MRVHTHIRKYTYIYIYMFMQKHFFLNKLVPGFCIVLFAFYWYFIKCPFILNVNQSTNQSKFSKSTWYLGKYFNIFSIFLIVVQCLNKCGISFNFFSLFTGFCRTNDLFVWLKHRDVRVYTNKVESHFSKQDSYVCKDNFSKT